MLKDKIALIYKKEGIVPEPMDVFTWDARDDRVFGPYTHADGVKMASNMNLFIARNELRELGGLIKRADGPFFVINREGKRLGGYEP